MKKLYVDLKYKKIAYSDGRREQLIWIFDAEKRTGVAVTPLAYSEKFGKKNFEQIEGEYLAIIAALDYPDYRREDLEIPSDSKTVIDVLRKDGKIKSKIKPYVAEIRKLSEKRVIIFTCVSREKNPAGFKAEGNPANKELRDLIEKDKGIFKKHSVLLTRVLNQR
jgi:ribonuclease HI